MDQPSSADDSGITLRIKFKSESVDEFIARYGADVSPGGIFIRTKKPLGVGTSLRFEFSLADGQSLLAGHGTVVWVREPDQTRAGVVAGMGVRFDKLTPESQNALGTILAGKSGKENSNAARLSAARPIIPAAPLEPESEAASRPTPASMRAVDDSDGHGTADPWQSDKTEIAESPPSFGPEGGRRTSEELSLSGAEPLDFGAARGAPPGGPTPVLPPRKSAAVPPLEAKAPLAALGSVIRDADGKVSTPVRRNSPASGVGATPITTPPAPAPAATSASALPPSRTLSEALGVPTSPPGMTRPPSVQAAPSAGEDLSTDPFNREGAAAAAAAVAARPGGRGKTYAVILVSALITGVLGLFGLKKLALQDTAAPPAPPPPAVVTTPAPPPTPAPTPTPPAPTTPPATATPTPTPPPAAAVPPPAPTPPPPAPAAAPPPAAKVAAPKAPKAPRPRKPPAETAAAEPAAPAAAAGEESSAVEEYWLRVRSTPAGAEVLIDGQVEGKTPFERRLFDPTRPYALTVRKGGFETHEQMLSASDEWVKKGNKRTLTVPVKLTKSKGGATEESTGDKPAEPAPVENPPAAP